MKTHTVWLFLDGDYMEPFEGCGDLVIQLEIKNSAFETDEAISKTFDYFISNVVQNMNEQSPTCKAEVTALLEFEEKKGIRI